MRWAAAGRSSDMTRRPLELDGAGLGKRRHRDVERAKWRLWHGRWKGCLIKLAEVRRWLGSGSIRHIVGVRSLRGHLDDLLSNLEASQSALVNYSARRRRGEPISTAFVESVVQRDHRQAHGEEAADALEPVDRAAFPRHSRRLSRRHSGEIVLPDLLQLPGRERRPPGLYRSLNPTTLHALKNFRPLRAPMHLPFCEVCGLASSS